MKNRATNARKLYEEHLAGSRSEYTATLDEAWMYVTYCNGIRKICYIKRGNQVPDNWVHQCSETFPKGFMVVGVMTGRGVLPLIKVPSKVKVNSEFYIECVLKPVIEQLKDLYPGEMDKVFLHHDKASSHTSNKTQQFLQEMKDTLGLNFIRNSDIPVKSPDASPLDFYGFGMLKQRLFNRRPKTEAGLWKAAQEEWSNVSLSKVKEVFAAWKVRCREIAKKKGKHIEHMKKIHTPKKVVYSRGGLISVTRLSDTPRLQEQVMEAEDLEQMTISDLPELKVSKSLVPATVQPSSYRVLVTNLHPSVSQEDIDELFGDIGSVLHSALTKPGSAIVTFRTREEALRACHTYHNRHLDGLPMYCNLMETQQALPISSRRVKVCEIAEAVGISGESVRNILYEEKGMPKALHKVGTAFAECRSKANAQMTFALYQFKRDPTDFVR
ncbi:POLDIP3 [Cordylochernes scorpioides]|uniref:POLDIP3 n=1 Tax=Cordylochernes scorpioides TaxID=51811 RepID=A0ABY6KNB6_9ARAC|nr:POLDIP3 [Cordylochernes scorpioides]